MSGVLFNWKSLALDESHLRLCQFTTQNISEKKSFHTIFESDNMCVNSRFVSMYDICRKSKNKKLNWA